MASAQKALGEVVDVALDPAAVRVEEVADQQNALRGQGVVAIPKQRAQSSPALEASSPPLPDKKPERKIFQPPPINGGLPLAHSVNSQMCSLSRGRRAYTMLLMCWCTLAQEDVMMSAAGPDAEGSAAGVTTDQTERG
eukprot:399738-Pyramimonas_sp.AAC.1